MDPQRSVLVVEDDDATRGLLAENLRADGFRVWTAAGAGEGGRAIRVRTPDLIVLDLMLGDGFGLDLLDRVRTADGLGSRIDPTVPVIVLSGRATEDDRVRSLRRGADEHLCKPFSYQELLARIRAVLRRAEGRQRQGAIRVGDLAIDPSTRSVHLAGRPIELSAKEFALLLTLATDPSRVFTKQALLRDIWGWGTPGITRTLDSHACRLRRKLGGEGRLWIQSVRGVGYRLTEVP